MLAQYQYCFLKAYCQSSYISKIVHNIKSFTYFGNEPYLIICINSLKSIECYFWKFLEATWDIVSIWIYYSYISVCFNTFWNFQINSKTINIGNIHLKHAGVKIKCHKTPCHSTFTEVRSFHKLVNVSMLAIQQCGIFNLYFSYDLCF